ncbi:hypothetical protein CRG98_039228 [Punica granatum]|nr:hypothetical protein CRG98_039228 [Punica granatum]
MPSSLLPVTNPSSRHSPPIMPPLLISKADDDDPTTRLMISSYDDEKAMQVRPLLSRTSSYSSTTAMAAPAGPVVPNGHQRRRRISSESCLPSLSGSGTDDGDSLEREVEHAAAETFLLTRLSLKLLRYLGVGYRWITRFLALGCYAFLLMPGFIQVGYSYFLSKQIRRGIVYGDLPRNRLDLYLPKNMDGPRPVIAFITGGAWIIG